jgi:hypothetical protein
VHRRRVALRECTIVGLYDWNGNLIAENDDSDLAHYNNCSRSSLRRILVRFTAGVAGYDWSRYPLRAPSAGRTTTHSVRPRPRAPPCLVGRILLGYSCAGRPADDGVAAKAVAAAGQRSESLLHAGCAAVAVPTDDHGSLPRGSDHHTHVWQDCVTATSSVHATKGTRSRAFGRRPASTSGFSTAPFNWNRDPSRTLRVVV